MTCERLAGSVTNGVAYLDVLGPAVQACARSPPCGATDQSRPPWPLIHSSCSFSRKSVASAGVLYVWFLQRVVDRRRQREELRDVAAGGVDARGALERGRGEHADPQAAVGGEGLLRGEVVDVRLGDVDRQAARAGGGVHQDQRALVGARDPLDRGMATPVEVSLCVKA